MNKCEFESFSMLTIHEFEKALKIHSTFSRVVHEEKKIYFFEHAQMKIEKKISIFSAHFAMFMIRFFHVDY
jgi:hypothetical protein